MENHNFICCYAWVWKTWSFTLREEHRLRLFKNRVRRIFGPKREEVAGDCTRLHNEVLHNLYASPNTIQVMKSRRMRCVGHVACVGDIRSAYSILVGRHGRKKPLVRSRCR
jgi:hypothetical protein